MKPCPHCGKEIQDEAVKCRWCLNFLDEKSPTEKTNSNNPCCAPSATPATSLAKQLDPTGSGTIIRNYKAKSQSDAVNVMGAEASCLLTEGYHPVTQNWAPGGWETGDFVAAVLACLFCIGIFVFIYMLIVKPAGTLTVTYQRKETPEEAAAIAVGKVCPRCAETVKLAAKVCRYCSHEFE